jgi:hypothetical protein
MILYKLQPHTTTTANFPLTGDLVSSTARFDSTYRPFGLSIVLDIDDDDE